MIYVESLEKQNCSDDAVTQYLQSVGVSSIWQENIELRNLIRHAVVVSHGDTATSSKLPSTVSDVFGEVHESIVERRRRHSETSKTEYMCDDCFDINHNSFPKCLEMRFLEQVRSC